MSDSEINREQFPNVRSNTEKEQTEINREQFPNVRSNTEKEQKPYTCVFHIIALLDLEYVRITSEKE